MSTTVGVWRVALAGRVLRGVAMALGLLCGALLTATVASAQTADLAVTQAPVFSPVVAGSAVSLSITVRNNGGVRRPMSCWCSCGPRILATAV